MNVMSSTDSILTWYGDGGPLAHPGRSRRANWQATAAKYGFLNDEELKTFANNAAVITQRGTIEFQRTLPIGIDQAWNWVQDRDRFASWFLPIEWEFRQGGTFQIVPVPDWVGTIGDLTPPHRIRLDSKDGSVLCQFSRLRSDQTRYQLIEHIRPDMPVPQNVIERFSTSACFQPGGLGTHWVGILAGWHTGTDTFEKLVFESVGLAWPDEKAKVHDFVKLEQLYHDLLGAHYPQE